MRNQMESDIRDAVEPSLIARAREFVRICTRADIIVIE